VEFDGVVRQPEAPGNLRVRQAGGDQRPHLALAGGEVARSAQRPPLDPATRRLREHELTGMHLADRGERLLW